MNMVQQLSPVGLVYTVGTTFFLFRLFTFTNMPTKVQSILSTLGHHSYFIYLFHPFALSFFGDTALLWGIVLTTKKIIALYLATTVTSLLFAMTAERISKKIPLVGQLLTGARAK